MAARLGKLVESLDMLSEQLESGFWYGESLLRNSPSLQSIQGNPDFERLVERNKYQRDLDQDRQFPVIILRQQGECQNPDDPCPMLLALHANASTAKDAIDFWKPAATNGWLVAIPQSSQAMWRGAYMWDDLEIAQSEIEGHVATLLDQYAIDPDRIVLAGHSKGGEVAIWLALAGNIEAKGFLAIGPAGPIMEHPERWNALVEAAIDRDLRGYILIGEKDNSISHEGIQIFVHQLREYGFANKLQQLPAVGHEFHPDYNVAILDGLRFLLEND